MNPKRHALVARLQWTQPGFQLDVRLDLPGRGVSALFGPSGSGKTTCLRALAGLLTHCRGRVEVGGEIWQDSELGRFVPAHRRAIGYVFQEASLFAHLDVQRNIEFGMKRVAPAQRRVALEQAVTLLGIAPLMQRKPETLSGGERQRVAIARALATSPRLLLMDEPMASLDAQRKAEILPYLETLHADLDIPMLYVTHAPDEVARLADHLVLLDAGRVLAAGPTAELMTRPDLPLAHGGDAGAVISAEVSGHDERYHLSYADFAGGRLSLPRLALAPGQRVRIRIQARDVSLTLAHQSGTSIVNILPVIVTSVSPDGPGQVVVGLDAAGTPLLARITARSCDLLQLQAGKALFAQIKGVAILNGT